MIVNILGHEALLTMYGLGEEIWVFWAWISVLCEGIWVLWEWMLVLWERIWVLRSGPSGSG